MNTVLYYIIWDCAVVLKLVHLTSLLPLNLLLAVLQNLHAYTQCHAVSQHVPYGIESGNIDCLLARGPCMIDVNLRGEQFMRQPNFLLQVFCCIETFVFVFLGIWMLLFMLCDWNDKAPKI